VKHLLGGFEVGAMQSMPMHLAHTCSRLHPAPDHWRLPCLQAMTFLKADKFTSLTVKPHEYDKYFRCVQQLPAPLQCHDGETKWVT
jgi:hypothetical protein